MAPQLVISELMAHPRQVDDAHGEWFELYNAGAVPVDIKGFRIATRVGQTHVISRSVVIAPHAFVVLGNNDDICLNGGVIEAYSYGASITVNDDNAAWLTLKTPDGTLVDSVAYSARADDGTIIPPTYSPHPDSARALKDVTLENTILGPDDGSGNWADATTPYGLGDLGTPGVGPGQPMPPVGPAAVAKLAPLSSAVNIGSTRKLTGCAMDAGGALVPRAVTWHSSDSTIATVDSTGLATGVAPGLVTITASAQTAGASMTLLVVPPGSATSISVTVASPSRIPVGYAKPAVPVAKDVNGKTVTLATHLTWSTSDTALATVDSLGYVTGVGPGTVTITARSDFGASGAVALTILPATATTTAVYRDNIEFGLPRAADPGNAFIVSRPQYLLSYNDARGGPNWVSWEISNSQFGTTAVCGCYSPDPDLPADFHKVVDADYRYGGYDHGQMVQQETRTTTLQENATTYRLTTVLPQYTDNARGPWSAFSTLLDSLARYGGKDVYVIAGGIYDANPPTLKHAGRVAIPSYTFKIAVVVDSGKGLSDVHAAADLQVVAVNMPNGAVPGVPGSAVGIRQVPWQTYRTTVRAIETLTGYNFLDALPDDIEALVETSDRLPVAVAGGPYAGAEGSPLPFDGTASSQPTNSALFYRWDFGDGTTGTGATPTHSYADNGTYTVTLTVADLFGIKASATSTATITNAAPAANFVVPGTARPGAPFTLALSNATDPSGADVAAGLQFAFNCGDGSGYGAFGKAAATQCAASDSGVRAVGARVSDKDGGVSEYTGTVTIGGPPVVGPWANEPAGFTVLSDYGWGDPVLLVEDTSFPIGASGWLSSYNTGASSIADSTAPVEVGPNVLQFTYAIGMQSGVAPATIWRAMPNVKQLYAGFWWKVSNPWQGNGSGVNKIAFIWSGNHDLAYFAMYGSAAGYDLVFCNDFVATSNCWIKPTSSHPVTLGVWHKIELLVDSKAQTFTWWLDGVQVGFATGFLPASGFDMFQFSPTWGGMDGQKTQTDYYWYGHVHLSGN